MRIRDGRWCYRLGPGDEGGGFASRMMKLHEELGLVLVDDVDQALQLVDIAGLDGRHLACLTDSRTVVDSGDTADDQSGATTGPLLVEGDQVVADPAAGPGEIRTDGSHYHSVGD
ncbi:hypothetical protein SDC9_136507 [bioreactor metagenome]|uniref:Uncharacterized protein n=1 Tax=bioreactor metagenome TaxID=1076179 RepID=A0A645DK15_9ZZZZ